MDTTPLFIEWWPQILAIILCLFGSAFFSSSETALTSLSEAKVHQLLAGGNLRAERLRMWLDKPNHLLTSILIGNNIVNILASALATSVATSIFNSRGLGIAVGLMTFIVLIFGEVVPKTFAKHNAERVAVTAMPLLKLSYYLVYPIMYFLVELSRILVGLFGGNTSAPERPVTEQDIEFMIDLGQREGVLEEQEEKMLHSVMDLSETMTREIMVPRTNMVAINKDVPGEELIRTIVEAGYTRVPVFEESMDNIVGILHAKDLLRYLEPSPHKHHLDFTEIIRPVYYVPESMRINDLLMEFQRRKTHLAVVVDEYGGTAGIVAMEDILEEIVGEIHDEHDVEEKQLRKLGDKHWLADAAIPVDDLGEQLGMEFPEEESYDSLGGFITSLAGRLLSLGEHIEWHDFFFTVKEADEKRLLKVEIMPSSMVAEEGEEGEHQEEGQIQPPVTQAGEGNGEAGHENDLAADDDGGTPSNRTLGKGRQRGAANPGLGQHQPAPARGQGNGQKDQGAEPGDPSSNPQLFA